SGPEDIECVWNPSSGAQTKAWRIARAYQWRYFAQIGVWELFSNLVKSSDYWQHSGKVTTIIILAHHGGPSWGFDTLTTPEHLQTLQRSNSEGRGGLLHISMPLEVMCKRRKKGKSKMPKDLNRPTLRAGFPYVNEQLSHLVN
ncbi:uncharacterized protein MYCFIDRAFT_78420, partial [Pseudocercospora fijiensis CIRAD86]